MTERIGDRRAERIADCRDLIDWSRGAVELASAVVGHVDHFDAVTDRDLRILRRGDVFAEAAFKQRIALLMGHGVALHRRDVGVVAEFVKLGAPTLDEVIPYDVVIDRISQDVPFYRAFLKNAALTGTAVVNNPFWWSADEKFFNNALATKIGVAVPRTVLLPSHEVPTDTNANSFRNLAYPLDWEAIFNYVGWPAFFKPFAGGGWKNVYRLHNAEEFYRAYSETGQLVMMLQEEVKFDMYFRCYSIDQRNVRIMPYEPRHPYHLRYQTEWQTPKEVLQNVERGVLQLNQYLGYDLNTVEFAIRDAYNNGRFLGPTMRCAVTRWRKTALSLAPCLRPQGAPVSPGAAKGTKIVQG